MSDPLPSSPSPAAEDAAAAAEEEEALQFARCSQPAAAAEPPLRGTGPAAHREGSSSQANLRRSHLTTRHLVISIATSLATGAMVLGAGWWWYVQKIAPRLDGTSPAAAPPPPAPAAPPAADAKALKAELAGAAGQIAALQKQLDVMRREQLLTQQNTRESLEKISTALKDPHLAPAPVEVSTSTQPGASHVADVKPDVSPTQKEFIQLKERNRLTEYADEAIATGMRRPLELLLEYMRDPQLEHLHYAAQAEFMRALRAIQILQREDPRYRLPVTEIFKDKAIRDEADVKPAALLKLLADYKQPWEVRQRVCFLLISSPLPETNAALLKSIKEDPSLDVAKHAQIALEQRVKTRFRFFDIPSIEDWFKKQGP